MADHRAYLSKFQATSAKDLGLPHAEIITFAVNCTGNRVVAAKTDGSLRIWRVRDRFSDCVVVERAHSGAAQSLAWNPSSEQEFASVARDTSIKIWRSNGRLEHEVKLEKQEAAHVLAYSRDGKLLAVGTRNHHIVVLDTKGGYLVVADIELEKAVYSLLWFNHEHTHLAATFQDGSFAIYAPLADPKPIFSAGGHRSTVTTLAVDPRGRYFAVGSTDGIVSLWSTESLVTEKVITSVDEAIAQVSISRDGNFIGVAYDSGSNVKIFDYETLEEISEISNSASGPGALSGIQWLPRGLGFVYITDRGRSLGMMTR